MKLLTVDDSSIVRKIIRTATRTLGMDLDEAQNGYEALEKLKDNNGQYDLIMLDCNMPGMSGLDVLRAIKSNEKYSEIPIMMVTTESSTDTILEAIRMGAVHYMIKPFAIEELMKRILECLGRGEL